MKLTHRVFAGACSKGMALLLAGCLASPSLASVTNDRDYRFGDTGSSDGSLGATVSEGNPVGFIFGGDVRTADETGPSAGANPDLGGFLDLLVPGASDLSHSGATYTDTSARPLAGAGEFGLSFDGVDDVLSGISLNIPQELATRISPSTYPFNFTGIRTRGLQMWVYPNQAGLDAGARQTIVMDTIESGGVSITADGQWGQIFDGEADDGDIPASVDVVGDTWHHVMHHVYTNGTEGAPRFIPGVGGDSGETAVVYVNGIAVSATNDFADEGGFDGGDRVGVLSVGAAELADQDEDPLTSEYGEFFNGKVDDLRAYVHGDNTDAGGQNYGSFNLFEDNEWIANEIATTVPGGTLLVGDVNRDGVVDLAGDVPAFVDGWLSQNVLIGWGNKRISVGDWSTWGKGDMNLDGTVDLKDWAIMNSVSPALGAAIAGAISAVPEPSSFILLAMAGSLGLGCVRRRSH